LSDNRGYQYWAGVHGVPGNHCRHHEPPGRLPLFLPWHRAYLYFFERALRDQVPAASLPWWDWTSPSAHQSGIPAAYADEQVGGRANPLAAGPVEIAAQPGGNVPMTERAPGAPAQLPSDAEIRAVLKIDDYERFSSRLQDKHDNVHGWVGGSMGIIAWAAYDPIFWAHHAMVDRIWALWQLNHHPVFPPSYLNQALPPFPMTVAQTLNVKTLGYDYAASTAHTVSGHG
jgi:tyrosinase